MGIRLNLARGRAARGVVGLVAGLVLAAAAAPASAAIRYEFTALSSFSQSWFVFGDPPETISGSFTIETADYIDSDSSFAPGDLLAFGATGSLTGALTAGTQTFGPGGEFEDYVIFAFVGGPDSFQSSAAYYFADGAFSAPGTYETVLFGSDQAGRLVVTNLGGGGGGGPEVPEPATWAMLIAGFGIVGVSLRRRRAAVA